MQSGAIRHAQVRSEAFCSNHGSTVHKRLKRHNRHNRLKSHKRHNSHKRRKSPRFSAAFNSPSSPIGSKRPISPNDPFRIQKRLPRIKEADNHQNNACKAQGYHPQGFVMGILEARHGTVLPARPCRSDNVDHTKSKDRISPEAGRVYSQSQSCGSPL